MVPHPVHGAALRSCLGRTSRAADIGPACSPPTTHISVTVLELSGDEPGPARSKATLVRGASSGTSGCGVRYDTSGIA